MIRRLVKKEVEIFIGKVTTGREESFGTKLQRKLLLVSSTEKQLCNPLLLNSDPPSWV